MTDKKIWMPQIVHGWLLIVTAFLRSALMAGLTYCMAYPVPWDGPGKLGAVALFFPLHLLAFTLVSAILAFLAKRSGTSDRLVSTGHTEPLDRALCKAGVSHEIYFLPINDLETSRPTSENYTGSHRLPF